MARFAYSREDDRLIDEESTGLCYSPSSRSWRLNGSALDLTPYERDLLQFFMNHRGSVVSASRIVETVWGEDCSFSNLHSTVERLRAKIGSGHIVRILLEIYNATEMQTGYGMPKSDGSIEVQAFPSIIMIELPAALTTDGTRHV